MDTRSRLSKTSGTTIMKILGATMACLFAFVIPFLYYLLSLSEIRDTLAAETVFISKSLEKIIQARPDFWEYETVSLREILSEKPIKGHPRERVIRNAAGTVVVKTGPKANRPAVTVSATLHDSGLPVGILEARYSIRTTVVFTALLAVLTSLIGFLSYALFLIYPVRKLESAMAELMQAEEEQRQSRQTAERLAEETAVIAEIGRLVSSTLDIDEVYERFAAEAGKLIPFDRLAVNIKHPHEDTIEIAYVSGSDIPARRHGDRVSLQGTLTGEILRTRSSLLLQPDNTPAGIAETVHRFPALAPNFQAGLLSTLSVPMIYRDEAVGVLHFRTNQAKAYTGNHLRLAERIGDRIAGAIVNARLFNDLRRTGASLRESEGRFRALVEEAAVGVAEIDVDNGRFCTVNRRLCEMVGRAKEELLDSTFQEITHPEDIHLHDEKTALMRAGKIRQYDLEKRYLRKDGQSVWVNITVSPLWKAGEPPGRNMVVVEDITERKRMAEEMREMSLRDQLTGLYNRRGFITLAEQQIRAANRAQRPLYLTFIDLDRLKWINDTFGHEKGDQVLADTAQLLRQTFRESDIIARLGGDEFAVLSVDAAEINQVQLAQRLQQQIDGYNSREERLYRLAMSWGTVVYQPDSSVSLDQLISAADELMYTQKKTKSPY
ncbi:MAG: diguanylate cyclase [Thermodesulfobacteriota bacterium]